MSIRENIPFSSPYGESRYRQVIAACALTEDLASFKRGDSSNIGENSVDLSGGRRPVQHSQELFTAMPMFCFLRIQH